MEERRQTARFSCNAVAVLKTPRGPVVASARILGLGIAGCRVYISRPLEAEQELELTIRHNGNEIVATVVVKYWSKLGFAGLHFTKMSPNSRKNLESLVEQIAKSSQEPEGSSPP
jgi:hypothetical protein